MTIQLDKIEKHNLIYIIRCYNNFNNIYQTLSNTYTTTKLKNMNSQDDDFNSLLNNVSTPDKPEIPIRTGTNALKDKFVISKASNLPLTTDKEESENPVLSSDQNESNTQAGILDSVISKASDLPLTDE